MKGNEMKMFTSLCFNGNIHIKINKKDIKNNKNKNKTFCFVVHKDHNIHFVGISIFCLFFSLFPLQKNNKKNKKNKKTTTTLYSSSYFSSSLSSITHNLFTSLLAILSRLNSFPPISILVYSALQRILAANPPP